MSRGPVHAHSLLRMSAEPRLKQKRTENRPGKDALRFCIVLLSCGSGPRKTDALVSSQFAPGPYPGHPRWLESYYERRAGGIRCSCRTRCQFIIPQRTLSRQGWGRPGLANKKRRFPVFFVYSFHSKSDESSRTISFDTMSIPPRQCA